MDIKDDTDVPSSNCVAKYIRSGGVAIYHNADNKANIITSNIEISLERTTVVASAAVSNVGDICIACWKILKGQDIITALGFTKSKCQ